MPIWAPPTPPQDENDIYIDYSCSLMYESTIMMESKLPQVYVKKEHKKAKVEQGIRKIKPHTKSGEAPHHTAHIMTPPQSLFNRPSAALLRMRREAKQQKLRAMAGKPVVKPLPIVHRATSTDMQTADRHEWLINEDWALLQAVQALQELPLTLQAVVPGHIINWDLVSDIVNGTSRIYRSPKQCRHRYESVIIPREEGKILYDTNPKKQKKSKGIYRQTKNNRPMKTSQLHTQDGNASHTMFYSNKFDLLKTVIGKRQPYLKQVLNNPLLKNPKHSAVLNDHGINYEKPMSPTQVATKRAERIAREKKASQEQQQRQRIQDAQAKQQQAVAAAAAVAQPVATATTATVMQAGPGTINRTALGPTAIRVTGGANSIVVNTPGVVTAIPGNSFANINKRMSQQQVGTMATISGATPVMATVPSSLGQVVRAQAVRTTIAHVSLPSSAGIITSQVRAPITSGAQVVITSAGSASQARSTPTGTATITAKLAANYGLIKQHAIKQQALLQQQQQQQAQIKLQAQAHAQAQAQAQAKIVQAEAQAQAQAMQKQLQSGQKPPTSNVTVSQVAAAVSATSTLAQPQLTQAGQPRAQVQIGGKTVTRPMKNEDLTALLKRHQFLASQRIQKRTSAAITTVPLTTVAGIKNITLSGLTVSPAAMASTGAASGGTPKGPAQQSQAQQTGSAATLPMKPLTIPSMVSKINLPQKGQHQAKQQQLLAVKTQQLLAQQKMQPGSAVVSQAQLQGASGTISPAQIRISTPSVSVAVTGSLASQVVQTTNSQRQRLSQQVSGLTPQQLQQVRVQRVTTSQAQASPAVVQRVGQVQQLATVRQQLQQQVKQSGSGGGATLSIQQAGKPVTIIPTVSGTSLLTVAKSMGGLSQTHVMTPSQKQILTQLMSSGGTQNMTQLARVISQAQALAQKSSQAGGLQPQQTVTVQSVPSAQQSRAQSQGSSTSGAVSGQVAGSGQVTASIQPQGTPQSASPVQVTLSAQPTKAGAQTQQSPAQQRHAAMPSAAQRLVQQAQTQQAQTQAQVQKQTGTVQARLQATTAAQQQLQQQKLLAQQQQVLKILQSQASQPHAPAKPKLELQVEAKPQAQPIPPPQAQPAPPAQEQATVEIEAEAPAVPLPSAQASASGKEVSDTQPSTSSSEQQQQPMPSKQQQPSPAAPVRASPYAMRLRKPSNPSKE